MRILVLPVLIRDAPAFVLRLPRGFSVHLVIPISSILAFLISWFPDSICFRDPLLPNSSFLTPASSKNRSVVTFDVGVALRNAYLLAKVAA